VASANEAALDGTIAASIYQGGHIDLYVDLPQVSPARILMRLSAKDANGLWNTGERIAIGISGNDAVAFPPVNA
jgi:putative spermidine/putrescine transport system ATP-binding protein/spermidine/putrescine transport system ATP-binding protein